MEDRGKSVKGKLFTSALPTLVLVAVLSTAAIAAIHDLDAGLARTYQKNLKGMAALTRANAALTAMRREARLRLNLGGAQNLSKLAEELPASRARIDRAWRNYYPARVATAAEKKQAEAAFARYRNASPVLDRFTVMVGRNDRHAASRLYTTKLEKTLAGFADSLDDLRAVQIKSAGQVLQRANAAARRWQWIIIAVAGVLVALALVSVLLVARTMTRPLAKARAFADSIARGRLDNPIEHAGDDEFGALIDSLAVMQQQLANTAAAGAQAKGALAAKNAELAAANAQLTQTEARYRQLFARNPLALYVVDRATLAFLEVNDTAQAQYGFERAEFLRMTLRDIEPAAALETVDARRLALDGEQSDAGPWQHVTRAGQTLDVELSIYAVDWGGAAAWLIAARDVTAARAAQQTLELRNQAIEASHNGIFICSAATGGSVCYVNAAMARFCGQAPGALIGRPLLDLFADTAGNDAAPLLDAMQAGHRGKAVIAAPADEPDALWLEVQVSPVTDAQDDIAYWVGVVVDLTERKAFEAKLAYRADHDGLTGLPNRRTLRRRLIEAIAAAERADDDASADRSRAGAARHEVAVLFLDLDGFKQINDKGGHEAGDVYLQTVAERLSNRIRAADTLARVGGDEFVLVTAGARLSETLAPLARRLQDAFSQPVRVAEQTFSARATIGIACYPAHGTDAETLLRRADSTMYTAKRRGEAAIEWFSPEMEARFRARSTIEAALASALAHGQFELHYQPQVDMRENTIVGVEALLRWPSADAGYASPADFIPIAEDTGQIVPIGAWVLQAACADLARLRADGYSALTMAINASAVQLRDPGFADAVAAALAAHALPAKALEIEVTQSVFMAQDHSAMAAVGALDTIGVRLAIDDCGAGFSSLGDLSRLPIDRLKIDRGFIGKLGESPRAGELVRAVARAAANLTVEVLAEGVETAAERDALLAHDCRLAQGFYYSKALPMAALVKHLAESATLAVAI